MWHGDHIEYLYRVGTIAGDPAFHGEGAHFRDRTEKQEDGHRVGNVWEAFEHHLVLLTRSSHSLDLGGSERTQSHPPPRSVHVANTNCKI